MSVSGRATTLAVLLILLASLRPALAAPPPDPDTAIEAEHLLQQGLELWNEKKYVEALERFRESNRRSPSSGALINAALCLLKLGRKFEAYQALDEGLRLPGDVSNRKALEGLLRKTHDDLPRLSIAVNEAGADISVDGRPVGQSPLRGHILVSPGPHTVSGGKVGFESVSSTVQIPDRERYECQVLLTFARPAIAAKEAPANEAPPKLPDGPPKGAPPKLPDAVAPTAAPIPTVLATQPQSKQAPEGRGRSPWKIAAVGSVALGLSAFVTGTVFALRAKSQFGAAEERCKDGCDPAGEAANANALSNADRATVASVAGGVVLAAALVFWLLGR